MREVEKGNILRNAFRLYRYEGIGIYTALVFSTESEEVRQSRDEDGWDEVTDLEQLLPKHRLRCLPFIREITEDTFLESNERIDLEDCIATGQTWLQDRSDIVRLFRKLNGHSPQPDIGKVGHGKFREMIGSTGLNELVSFDVRFTYHYDRSFNHVEMELINIVSKNKDALRGFHSIYVDKRIPSYYFGVDSNYSGRSFVSDLMRKEYLLSPAMVMDRRLYLDVKDKIGKIYLDCDSEK